VVLPLLRREVVLPAWISEEQFMAGYDAVRAVSGPLFTFAAYLGAPGRGLLSGWALWRELPCGC
jgi:chromate transporter